MLTMVVSQGIREFIGLVSQFLYRLKVTFKTKSKKAKRRLLSLQSYLCTIKGTRREGDLGLGGDSKASGFLLGGEQRALPCDPSIQLAFSHF